MLPELQGILMTISPLDIVDIALVAFVLYKLYMLIRDTRAVQVLKGLILLVFANLVSRWLGLHVTNWLLQQTMTIVVVALPVVFQPELRRTLEQLGRSGFFRSMELLNEEQAANLVDQLTKVALILSRNKIGALIVLERETMLGDYIETGIPIDAVVTAELLVNVFIPNTPLHDGAVIIRGSRVMAAGCLLPLTEQRGLAQELGTRHRAALGISEQSDAIVLIVSEETGTISLARGGKLTRHLDDTKLAEQLTELYASKNQHHGFFPWRSKSK